MCEQTLWEGEASEYRRMLYQAPKSVVRIPGDHIMMILGQRNTYKRPQSAEKFGKVKKVDF